LLTRATQRKLCTKMLVGQQKPQKTPYTKFSL
jgi:hypothetical protein